MEVPITLDGKSFANLRLGFNGYIGAMNSSKDYRIIPIFLMNYDLSLAGGIVRYTEKEKGAFRRDLIGQTQRLFNIRLDDPKCILVTWDDMVPTNSTQCYKVCSNLRVSWLFEKTLYCPISSIKFFAVEKSDESISSGSFMGRRKNVSFRQL